MSLTIDASHAYSFLAGLYVGKFTNIFSDMVISGLILYIVTPEIFTRDRWENLKCYVWNWVRPPQLKLLTDKSHNAPIELCQINNNVDTTQPKIVVLKTPGPLPIPKANQT